MTRQLPVLTSLRGIAALSILLHHITVYFLPELGKYIGQFTPFLNKSYLWVDFFFILSGFVACHAHQKHFSHQIKSSQFFVFITSRFTRLYPLHFITLTVLVIMEFIYLFFYTRIPPSIPLANIPIPFDCEYSVKALLLNLLFIQALPKWSSWNQPAWALSAIWITAFTIPFTITVILRTDKITRIFIVILCLIPLFLIEQQKGTLDFLCWPGMVRCFTETVIGIAAYTLYRDKNRKPLIYGTAPMLYFLFLLTLLSLFLPIRHGVTIILFLALIPSAACVESDPVSTHPILIFSGKISFSLYMVQWLSFEAINKIS